MPHGSPKAKKIRKLVEKVDNIALLQNLIATLPGIEKKKRNMSLVQSYFGDYRYVTNCVLGEDFQSTQGEGGELVPNPNCIFVR